VAEQESGPSIEVVAIAMFFSGFVLGVQAESTNIPKQTETVAKVASVSVSAASSPHALRGMTGLLQLGGAVSP
jgi:hypothetical protein